MIRICCKCGANLGEKPPLDDKSVTHTYCPTCAAELEAQFAAYRTAKKQKENPK